VPPSNVVAADLADWQRPPAAAAVLRSGVLDPFPTLLPPGRRDVTLGSDGPFTLTLDPLPASLAEAAGALQSALRAASPAPAFSGACVLALGSTLNVLPGLRGAAVVCGRSARRCRVRSTRSRGLRPVPR
jgi:hypothetical protein